MLALALATAARAAVEAVDALGRSVRLAKPAGRIVSFAPHVTELLFAVGAGAKIVGAVEHSDYPEAAKRIPRVGSNVAADLERIVAMRPDLIIAWLHGASMKQLERLRSTGIPVYFSDPRTLEAIVRDGERLAALAGTEREAAPWAAQFRQRHEQLRLRYSHRASVKVFYQVWAKPIYTLNGEHFVSDVLAACGAKNVFGALAAVAPVVDTEAVLGANPQVIAGAMPAAQLQAQWRPWRELEAVRLENIFGIDADRMHRAGPRAIDAAEALCERIDEARRRIAHDALIRPDRPPTPP